MLAPACWFGALLVSYALQPFACVYAHWLLPAVHSAFLIPLSLVLWAAAQQLYRLRHATGRDLFVALLGVLMPAVFVIALLWSGLAAILFSACE